MNMLKKANHLVDLQRMSDKVTFSIIEDLEKKKSQFLDSED